MIKLAATFPIVTVLIRTDKIKYLTLPRILVPEVVCSLKATHFPPTG
jgi:hypothetical protein